MHLRHTVYVALAVCTLWSGAIRAAGTNAASLTGDEGGNTDAEWAEKLSSCVVYLDDDSSKKYITGTLLYSSGPVVVTNYHVLSSSADALRVYLATETGIGKFPGVFVKGDKENDLAAFRIRLPQHLAGRLIGIGMKGTAPNRCIAAADFAPARTIRRGYRVIFLGFPLNYGFAVAGDGKALIKDPVFRSGVIALETVRDEFLIDAMVSNGNSGSPVFVHLQQGTGKTRRTEYRFAGLIKQYQHDCITLRIAGDLIDVPHNAGLGIVVPAVIVERFLKDMPVAF